MGGTMAVGSIAQASQERAMTVGLFPADVFALDSQHVDDTLEVTVVLPRRKPPTELVGAIYVLDPIWNLAPTLGATHMLATFAALTGADFPPLAFIGIGYPTADPISVMGLRARDLTPTGDGFPTEMAAPPVPFGFGRADRFLAALVDEVIPTIEARFPVRPGERTLLGHSFGGLFGLYTLFHRPDTFRRYLMVSPSIWWDNRIVLEYEEQWANAHSDLKAHLFVAVGDNEQVVGDTWRNERFSSDALKILRQVDNARELTARLNGRRYPGLSVESVVFEDEYHLTIMPAAVTRGLVSLFDD